MSSLFSAPKAPTVSTLAPPTPAITPLPAPTPDVDPAVLAEQALARRDRGVYGTIATALTGVPVPTGLPVNSLLPVRKSLFGE
jgi:hypothetical protein